MNNYDAFIFDLDGTLYESRKIDEANLKAAISALSSHLSINENEARNLIDKTRIKLGKNNQKHSISGTMKFLETPEQIIRKKQEEFIKPELYLKNDTELVALLKKLNLKSSLALLTNTPRFIAIPILNALGIDERDFDYILTGDELINPKPSKKDVERIITKLNCKPNKTIFVGDRYHVDIAPAKELGLSGVLIQSRDDLINFLKQCISA